MTDPPDGSWPEGFWTAPAQKQESSQFQRGVPPFWFRDCIFGGFQGKPSIAERQVFRIQGGGRLRQAQTFHSRVSSGQEKEEELYRGQVQDGRFSESSLCRWPRLHGNRAKLNVMLLSRMPSLVTYLMRSVTIELL